MFDIPLLVAFCALALTLSLAWDVLAIRRARALAAVHLPLALVALSALGLVHHLRWQAGSTTQTQPSTGLRANAGAGPALGIGGLMDRYPPVLRPVYMPEVGCDPDQAYTGQMTGWGMFCDRFQTEAVDHVHWQHWGWPQAVGRGEEYVAGAFFTSQWVRYQVNVIASDIFNCGTGQKPVWVYLHVSTYPDTKVRSPHHRPPTLTLSLSDCDESSPPGRAGMDDAPGHYWIPWSVLRPR